jgi:invasion protein IalB
MALRSFSANGNIEFKNAGQHDVAIPVSFKGFDVAYDGDKATFGIAAGENALLAQ